MKRPTIDDLKEISVGIKREEDFTLTEKEKKLLEIYKKRFKGDKNKINERDYFESPATE